MMASDQSWASLKNHVFDHLVIAGPVIFSFVMRKSVDLVSVIFVGHLGAQYLSSAGLASVTANVTGNSMIIGLAGPLTTLCSQANGSKNYKELSLCLQRAMLILIVFICIPMSFLWLFSEDVMLKLGQTKDISHLACTYLRAMIPGLWAMAFSACIQNWLYAMSKTKALVWITLSLAILHPIICYVYIFPMKLGYLGAAYAVSTTRILELVFLLIYLNCFSKVLKHIEFQFSTESFRHWYTYIKIGIPNLLMMSEWWASEIIIFLSGTLQPDPESQVGAMSVYQNLLAICFMFPSGFRVSGETIVGNALGAGSAHIAATASYVAPALTFLTTTIIGVVMITNSTFWGRIFTDDDKVISLVSGIIPVCSLYVVLDGMQASLTGVIKGMGKQRIAGPVVVIAYYAIGIPISAYLALEKGLNWGIYGLCVGTLIGTFCHLLVYMYIVYGSTNWDHEVTVVQDRNHKTAEMMSVSTKSKDSGGSDGSGATGGGGDYEMVQTSFTETDTDTDTETGNRTSNSTTSNNNNNSIRSIKNSLTDDSSDSWWDDLSFFEPQEDLTSSMSRLQRHRAKRNNGGGRNGDTLWGRILGAFGVQNAQDSEYERVRTFTDSFSLNPMRRGTKNGLDDDGDDDEDMEVFF